MAGVGDTGMTASRTLIVTIGGQVLMTSTLSRPTYKIGRLPDNDLVLPDPLVSQSHAEIRLESGRAILTDLGSEQGTFVAGVRLLPLQPHMLFDGVTIRIAPYEIIYRSKIDVPLEGDASADETEGSGERSELFSSDEPGAVSVANRRVRPAAKPNGGGAMSGYLPYLPVIFHESDFLSRFLQIFETVWEPLEQRQDHIDMYFSPRTCPASWLPWFASWFGLAIEPHMPEERARALLAETIEIYRWRGTRYGLARMIEVCTGVRPDITENPSEPNVFRVGVRVPKNASPDFMVTLRELIKAHKPVHTGYVIEVQR
jgi:phage tail-like protein